MKRTRRRKNRRRGRKREENDIREFGREGRRH